MSAQGKQPFPLTELLQARALVWRHTMGRRHFPALPPFSAPYLSAKMPHVVVKIHVVGYDVDVGMEHLHLPDDFFQDVANASREDEQGDVVLVQGVEESPVPLPEREANSE